MQPEKDKLMLLAYEDLRREEDQLAHERAKRKAEMARNTQPQYQGRRK